MIIEKIERLCNEKGITITSLCKEITGSSGNLPTWRKDNIKTVWLKDICMKFKISSDFLLDIPQYADLSQLDAEEYDVLYRYLRLNSDNRIMAQSRMIELFEKQEHDSVGSNEPQDKTI